MNTQNLIDVEKGFNIARFIVKTIIAPFVTIER
jgi:hypothetical protein